ncbi:hypothetical protein RF11_04142 [Thelohanellus kitauei]|uniref:Uncharacterized protein n=1 Tax=Thelohanellus kitauei TaxID=669202 RepID=A0A0C2NCH7_THEKT|nr:hypothetical protein RF11_04142 [Thelohanellus kitauei]
MSGLYVKGYKCTFLHVSYTKPIFEDYSGNEAYDSVNKPINSFRNQKYTFSSISTSIKYNTATIEIHGIDVWYLKSTEFINDYIRDSSSDSIETNNLIRFHKVNSRLDFSDTQMPISRRFNNQHQYVKIDRFGWIKKGLIIFLVLIIVLEVGILCKIRQWYLEMRENPNSSPPR